MPTVNDEFKKKLDANKADTYETYLAKEGAPRLEGYLSSLSEIKATDRLSSTDFGASAEKLSSLGLSGSGYEDYLRAENAKKAEARENAAALKMEASDFYNRSGYAKYLSDYEALQEKISNSVITSVVDDLSFNLDDAYRLAVNSGLSEAYAEAVAKSAVSKARRAAVKKAIAYAEDKGLSALQAKEYASSLGLDGRYLEEVYDTVSYFDLDDKRYFGSISTKDYLEYLKEQAKKNAE